MTDTVRKGMLDLSMMTREQLVYGMLGLLAAGTPGRRDTLWTADFHTHSIVGAIVGFGAIAVGLDAVKGARLRRSSCLG